MRHSRRENSGSFWRLTFAGITVSLAAAVILVAASRTGLLPAAPDEFTYDWRTALLSPAEPDTRADIAVVLINGDSMTGYPYVSPVDRQLLADVVRAVDAGGPKAIGLDFIFDQPTEPAKDSALKKAIKEARSPVVVGAIDSRTKGVSERNFQFQDAFLKETGRPAGHLYFVNQKNQLAISDQTIRYIAGDEPREGARPSLTRLLADIDGKKPAPASQYIAWLLPPSSLASPTFQTFRVRAHRDEDRRPAGEPFPKSWQEALRGRIVLIGGEFADRDVHLTPLSVADDTRMHGVFIHAQILAQLRDGRSIHLFSIWQELLAVALAAGAGFAAALRWKLRSSEWLVSAGALGFATVTGLILFAAFSFVLPSATLILAWPAGLVAGNWCESALSARGSLLPRFKRGEAETG